MGKWEHKPPHQTQNIPGINNTAQTPTEALRTAEASALLAEEMAEEITLLEALEQLERANELIPEQPRPTPLLPPIPSDVTGSPSINPLQPCDTTIRGMGIAGSLVRVTFSDGTLLTTTVDADGLWSVPISTEITLSPGDTLTATQTAPGKKQSLPTSLQVTVNGNTLTGYVFPVAYDDHGLGAEFLAQFDVQVQLLNPDTCQPVASTIATLLGSTGTWCMTNVPAGDYILYLYRPGYLPRTLAVHVDAGNATTPVSPPDVGSFELWGGDLNSSRTINNIDVALMASHIGETYPAYPAYADLNADGIIDQADLDIVLANITNLHNNSNNYSGNVNQCLNPPS
jgi:hypothetical protein